VHEVTFFASLAFPPVRLTLVRDGEPDPVELVERGGVSRPAPLQGKAREASAAETIRRFLLLGATHILPFGLDHVLFVAGLALGYLLIPVAINFLLDFSLPGVPPLLRLADYIGFVTTLLLAFGLALQFPVILYLFARLGILSYAFLSRRRRFVALLIVLFAIVITPGDIVIGSATLAVVMYGLFEATLQLIRILGR
jgi:Sec-independent protein secretion pathway component TatC